MLEHVYEPVSMPRYPSSVVIATDDDRIFPAPRRCGARAATVFSKHIGLYVYQRDSLAGYAGLPVGPLEKAERVEQLRALENGHAIRVVETEYESLGVDTPADLERVSRLFEASMESAKRNG